MGSAQIRELLHEYINKADDRFINLMYAMVQAKEILVAELDFARIFYPTSALEIAAESIERKTFNNRLFIGQR